MSKFGLCWINPGFLPKSGCAVLLLNTNRFSYFGLNRTNPKWGTSKINPYFYDFWVEPHQTQYFVGWQIAFKQSPIFPAIGLSAVLIRFFPTKSGLMRLNLMESGEYISPDF